MTLSKLGELGLLAELERRGLIAGVEHDAAQLGRRPGRHPGRARRGRPLPARLDRLARARLAGRRRQPERPRRLGRRAGGAGRHARAPACDRASRTSIELYEGIAETGVPVVGGDTTAAPVAMLSVTALGRSATASPAATGARPGDLLVVTGPLGAAGRRVSRAALRAAAASARRGQAAGCDGARDARHLRRDRRRRRPPRAPLGRPLHRRARPRPARSRARRSTTSASARTTSCWRPSTTRAGSRSSAASRQATASSSCSPAAAVRAPRLASTSSAPSGTTRTPRRKCARGRAPMTVSLASPCSNRITVGIESTS